ncbi:MAG: c-type cytochrome [Hyphomicrobiaceae bacterium]
MERIFSGKPHDRVIAIASFALAIAMMVSPGWHALAGDTSAKTPPDPVSGKALAEQLCAGCHLVSDRQKGRVVAGVPSFDAIANRPDQSVERIFKVIIRPHAPMPDMHLTRTEIGDIIAYLDTLRRPDAGAPLIDKNRSRKKPVYPKQS